MPHIVAAGDPEVGHSRVRVDACAEREVDVPQPVCGRRPPNARHLLPGQIRDVDDESIAGVLELVGHDGPH
jgi:hypothetical protein